MIPLTNAGTADKLEVITTGTVSIDYVVAQIDKLVSDTNPTTVKTVVSDGNIASATTTKITTDPAASHEAMIREISLVNTHASATCTVQLQLTINGGTARKYSPAYSLAPGERILINADGTLFVYDATGGVKSALAAAMSRTVLSIAGSGTYNTPVGCRAIDVLCIGGGGGSGGVPGAASSVSVSGGGGSGAYARKLLSPPAASYAYTVGAAGAAGAAGANAGGNGGTSTFGTSLLSAPGGAGSPAGIAATTTDLWAEGGIGGAVATGGDINASGSMGFPGHRSSGTTGKSGGGGDSVVGGGGNARTTAGAGTVGDPGTGGGAGGAMSTSATTQAGAAGSAGVIVVTEYY